MGTSCACAYDRGKISAFEFREKKETTQNYSAQFLKHFKVLMHGSEPKDVALRELAAWEGRISKSTVKLVGAAQEPKEGGDGGGLRVGCRARRWWW